MHGVPDLQKLRFYSGDLLIDDPQAQAMLKELTELYHMDAANENYATLPQVGGLKENMTMRPEWQG